MANYNISNIFNKTTVLNNDFNNKTDLPFNIGDIFTASIKSVDDKYATLEAKGVSFTVPKSDIDTSSSDLTFEVVSKSSKSTELRQIKTAKESTDSSKISQKDSEEILELFKKNNLYIEKDVLETDDEVQKETEAREIIQKIQSQILYSANNTSDSAILELLANNISITKITLDILTKVTQEIDKKPFTKPTDEEITEITNKYLKEQNISEEGFAQKAEIIKALKENGLNVTESNISQIESAMNKFSDAVSSENYESLVTLDYIDVNKFVEKSFSTSKEITDEVSKNETLYKELATKLNLTYSDDLKDVFNKFLALDIDINKENIDKLSNIYTTIENISTEDLIQKMATALSSGKKATDVSLLENTSVASIAIDTASLLDKTLNTKDILKETTLENISYLVKNNSDLTVFNIKNATSENLLSDVTFENVDEVLKTQKNVLMLIQKLTFESAYRLSKSSIDIDTMTVTKALEEISNKDIETYKVSLSSVMAEQSEENISTMTSFFSNLTNLATLNNSFNKVSGDAIISDTSYYKNLFKNSVTGYEVFSTKVTSKWNDVITDYEEQIIPILENLGLEPSKENIKASESLIRAKIDITAENVIDVKTVNLKIDQILDTLHPRIVAGMIKDNINPLNLTLDEIIAHIDTFEDEYGNNLSDKIAKNIIEAQKDATISDETISAMKSFYKALNIISKNDKVSVAKTVESNHDLTIKNLLDTAKYFEKTRGNKSMIDKAISDEITVSMQNENSIRNKIDTALQLEYEKALFQKLEKESNYNALSNAIETTPAYEDALIEDFIETLTKFNANNIDKLTENNLENYKSMLNEALSQSPLSINFLLEQTIPLSLENLASFKDMIESPFKMREKLKNVLKDDTSLKSAFSEISEKDISSLSGTGSVLDIAIGDIEEYVPSTEDLQMQKTQILSSLNLMSLFNKNEENAYSQMVVKLPLSDEVTTINMFVIDDNFETKQTKTIAFSLETDYLGKIEANLNISLNSADISINGDYNGINFLKDSENEIKELFLQNGYKDVSIEFNSSDIVSMFNRGIYGK